jgi:manganese efflux pump family protein
MSFLALFLIGLGLAMDCFAVAVSFGTSKKLTGKYLYRTALFFALFQGFMPVIGWLIGDNLKYLIESVDHWIAFSILALIGLKMVVQSFGSEIDKKKTDIRNIYILLGLSLATSIDALITGVSFGVINVPILEASLIIGSVTFLMTILGSYLGHHAKFISAHWAERIGGLMLIAIGVKIVLDHLNLLMH